MALLRSGEILPRLRPLAIMTAFNEGDVVCASIGALIAEGIDVYLIDNCSTDDTVEQALPWLGRGLVHIERFPDDSGFSERSRTEYVWHDILTRVEQVACEREADWYLFVNADEFRESPFPDLDLREALAFVDSLGFNAIDFELFDFQPVDDNFRHGSDVRDHIRLYERGQPCNTLQIKGWKRTPGPVRIAESGGHDISFPGRRLFPIPFILRHYGIRGETHGRRKVFGERLPRFAPEERAQGWHVQYDHFAGGVTTFLRDPATLTPYDRPKVCAELLARASRALLLASTFHALDPSLAPLDSPAVAGWAGRVLGSPAELAATELNSAVERAALIAHGGSPDDQPPAVAAAARLLRSEQEIAGDLHAARRFAEAFEKLAAARPPLCVRTFTTLAVCEELLDQPRLLHAYAEHFGADDDATLIVHVRSAEEASRLASLVGELGLNCADAPDMLAVADGPSASALLSERSSAEFSALPRFGADRVAALRALAETRWIAVSDRS